MTKSRQSQLANAIGTRQLIRFTRRYEKSLICGYVLDIGPKFFLLALVSDRIRFDGYECFCINDVRGVTAAPYTAFIESALQIRQEHMPQMPSVSVASIEELLCSASNAFPLVTIHRENADPDVCWIGRVVRIERGHVSLLEIRPDATWESTPAEYLLSEITRVNFGGDYEDALYLVGGEPPLANSVGFSKRSRRAVAKSRSLDN